MKILVVLGWIHPKNERGLKDLMRHLEIDCTFGTELDINSNYDLVYCPSTFLSVKYDGVKAFYGPHLFVFPPKDRPIPMPYIQPSLWTVESWAGQDHKHEQIYVLPFPVDTKMFRSAENMDRNLIFIYYKHRDPRELEHLINYMNSKDVCPILIEYGTYNETDYLQVLQRARYGIFLDAHESQGFALEEALSCNTPLLVWSVTDMAQEYGQSNPHVPATTVPYWDARCGEVFYDVQDLPESYERFMSRLDSYRPRDYIMENLSVEPCSRLWSAFFKNQLGLSLENVP